MVSGKRPQWLYPTSIIISFLSLRKSCFFLTAKTLKILVKIILAYITLPSILFILSFPMSTPVKIIITGILIYSFVKAYKIVSETNIIESSDGYYVKPVYILITVVILTLNYVPLFCGRGYVPDWSKNRSVLLCLYNSPLSPTLNGFKLPPGLDLENAHLFYYYAMYLPSAYLIKILTLFVKVGSIELLVWFLAFAFFSWNMFGLVLVFLLIPASCKKIFAGKDSNGIWGIFPLVIMSFANPKYWYGIVTQRKVYLGHAEWVLPYYANIPSVITHWQWAPSQLVVGLLSAALILLYAQKIRQFPLALYAALLFSSFPWCLIGLFPTALYFVLTKFFSNGVVEFRKKVIDFLWGNKIELLSVAVITVLMLVFYFGNGCPVKFILNPSLLRNNGFLKYLLFLLIELAPVAIIIVLGIHEKISMPGLIKIQFAALFLLPLFDAGLRNDLVLKSTIPAYFLVIFYSAVVIKKAISDSRITAKVLLIVYCIVALPMFLNEYCVGLRWRSELLEGHPNIIIQYQSIYKK